MMKRKLITLFLVAGVAFLTPCTSEAQGLGGLLKKGKKALESLTTTNEKPTEAVTTKNEESRTKTANSVTFDNGIEMINPLAEYIDVTPVGLYAISKSENYGDAYVVLKVLMKDAVNTASFGGNMEQKMIAVDANGKVYNTDAGIYPFDTPEGIPVNIVIDKYGLVFTGIKKNIEVMPMVKVGIWLGKGRKGILTLKNVPIFWDQSPE